MELVKIDFKNLKKLKEDTHLNFGSYLFISEEGQVTQVKFIKGKFFHDFDCAKHYPISNERLKDWGTCYFIKGLNPAF